MTDKATSTREIITTAVDAIAEVSFNPKDDVSRVLIGVCDRKTGDGTFFVAVLVSHQFAGNKEEAVCLAKAAAESTARVLEECGAHKSGAADKNKRDAA